MIVAGFGFRASASVESLRSAYDLAASTHAVTALASAETKAQAASLTALAKSLSLPVLPVSDDDLKSARTITQSPHSQKTHATGSVAEAAALIAAGPGARLVSARYVSQDQKATCAIAIGDFP